MSTAYATLRQRFARISHLRDAQGMLEWDNQTMMPEGGAEARGEQLATLSSLSHELMTAPDMADLFAAASQEEALSDWDKANVREMQRAWRHATAVEARLVEALSIAGTRCNAIWRKARPANDFSSFAPALEEVMGLVREVAAQKAAALGCEPYDALIDQFEPGMTAASIGEVFAPLREQLPALIEEVLERQSQRMPGFEPVGPFSVARQKELGLRVMKAIGFDFHHGRLDVSAHPFCGGIPTDIRMTTRYREDVWLPSLMGIVHETGHALYEQGLPREWAGQPVGTARSMAIHESQSLMWEMQIARSPAFIAWLAPHVREVFDVSGAEWEATNLTTLSHRVERGLIRVDADEVTYPAHVLLRFGLEADLVAGRIAVRDLPEAWRAGMKELLGIEPDSDRNGCMQDIHWTDGSVGYFPSYTLGAMTAAQLAQTARQQVLELDEQLREGEFGALLSWLQTHVHRKASLLSTSELVVSATGSPLSAAPFLAHLRQRYLQDAGE